MDTSLFGVIWKMLHFYAFFLPRNELTKEQIATFTKFVEFLVTLVPCGGCSYHASRYFVENYASLRSCSTGKQIFEWTVMFHNNVNERLSRRTFSVFEAESALMMHLTGRSKEQFAIEDDHTRQRRKIQKLEAKLLMLQNMTHKIPQITNDARLTQMFAHHPAAIQLDSYEDVFRAFLLIALEYNFEKPIATQVARNAQDLLCTAFELFPNADIATKSMKFYSDNKPNFVYSKDIFEYVLLWYNTFNTPIKTKDQMLTELREWSNQVFKRQAVLVTTKTKDNTTIHELQDKYNSFFKQKQEQDAMPLPTYQSQANVVTLSCALLVITILLVVFIGLYSSARQSKHNKKK